MKEEDIPEGLMKRDHMTVMLEKIYSKIGVFGDKLKGFEEKTEQGFEEVFKRLDRLDSGFTELRLRVKSIEDRLTRIESDIAVMKNDLASVKKDLNLFKKDEKKKVFLEEFKVLENRVVILEKRLSALEK